MYLKKLLQKWMPPRRHVPSGSAGFDVFVRAISGSEIYAKRASGRGPQDGGRRGPRLHIFFTNKLHKHKLHYRFRIN